MACTNDNIPVGKVPRQTIPPFIFSLFPHAMSQNHVRTTLMNAARVKYPIACNEVFDCKLKKSHANFRYSDLPITKRQPLFVYSAPVCFLLFFVGISYYMGNLQSTTKTTFLLLIIALERNSVKKKIKEAGGQLPEKIVTHGVIS